MAERLNRREGSLGVRRHCWLLVNARILRGHVAPIPDDLPAFVPAAADDPFGALATAGIV